MLKRSAALALLGCLAFNAQAEHCSVNFNYGVIIDPLHIRILDKDQTYVQFNGTHQVFVKGREIELSPQAAETVTEFVQGIREQVPQIVSLAIEGVELGLKTVNNVIGSLTGENSAAHRKVQEKFDEMQWRLRKRFNHSDQSYYVAPQDFDEFDDIVAGQFEDELEEILSQSIGTILSAVGEAMANHDEDNIEQRATTYDQPIEVMGDALEVTLGEKASTLEEKAEQFCINLAALDKVEEEMQVQVPQLAEFDLISTQTKHNQQ